jgi:hypothetical protein
MLAMQRQKWQPRRRNARRNLALSNLETPDIFWSILAT